ncbi:Uncharacterised protein [Bordetella pertussis]|nr:Uncharacterised protein [Bordetella pertussis]
MVSEKPITPVMGISDAGMLAGVACSCAADELMPSVNPQPSPRYPAAPAAR